MKSWKKTYSSSFSDFSLGDLTWGSWKSWKGTSSVYYKRRDEELSADIKNAYQQAQDLITVMDLPFKVNLKINNDGAGLGGERVLKLPTSVFDDKSIPENRKVLISTGQAVHEASHLKDTEMRYLNEARGLVRVMASLLEDERIEDKLLSERPGFVSHIQEVRKYDTELLEDNNDWNNLTSQDKYGDFWRGLFSVIRYPELATEEIYNEYKDVYDEVKDIISAPNNDSTKECVKRAEKVYDIIKKYLQTPPPPPPFLPSMEGDESGSGDESTESKGSDGKKDTEKSDKEKENNAENDSKGNEGENPSGEETDTKSGTKGGFGLSPMRAERLMDFSAMTAAKAFRLNEMQTGFDMENASFDRESISSSTVSGDTDMDCKITQKDSEYGSNSSVTFTKMIGDPSVYNEEKSIISPYISAVRKLLTNVDKNYDFVVRGMRSGYLDTNKIAEAYQGVPQVYTRKGLVSTNETRICILIDESGSMCGTRAYTARRAAILLREAFNGIKGTELYIYGHSADQVTDTSTELYIYQEGRSYNPGYSLSRVRGRCQNRDHIAIEEVCKRIRKFTDDHVIMFILSDGEPAARYYGGLSAMRQVRKVVNKYEKNNFDIIQINVDDDLSKSDMKEMFNNYIYLEDSDLSEFPRLLSGIIKKAVKSDKSTKIQVL